MRLTSTKVILVETPDTKDQSTTNIFLADLKKSQIMAYLVKAATYPDRYTLALAADYIDPERDEAKDLVTLSEYLEAKGIKVNRSQKHKLANIVNDIYVAEYGQPPRTITRPNTQGKWLSRASGFEPQHLKILDRAIDEVLS